MTHVIKNSLKGLAIFAIAFYQYVLSPLLPASCRFYPSCSEYARQAIEKYGFFKGCFLSLIRIIKCHPFNEGGYDPIP